jgi:hypothetical protein
MAVGHWTYRRGRPASRLASASVIGAGNLLESGLIGPEGSDRQRCPSSVSPKLDRTDAPNTAMQYSALIVQGRGQLPARAAGAAAWFDGELEGPKAPSLHRFRPNATRSFVGAVARGALLRTSRPDRIRRPGEGTLLRKGDGETAMVSRGSSAAAPRCSRAAKPRARRGRAAASGTGSR